MSERVIAYTLHFPAGVNTLGLIDKWKQLRREKKLSLRYLIKGIFSIDDSVEKISLSFAVGLFIAFSPLFGTHLLTVLLIVLIFNVNKSALLAGALVNNPWTVIPMYTAGTFLGFLLLNQPLRDFPKFTFSDFLSLGAFYDKFKFIFYPYLLGCTVLGIIASVISYFIMRFFINKRREKAEA